MPGPLTASRAFLIVNADDLGLHPDINAGIEPAHREGIVTSASLVACGEAWPDAARVCRERPDLDVGVHLTLVGGERPVRAAELIPSLVDRSGRFLPSHRELTARVLNGRVVEEEVEAELEAQFLRIVDAGLAVSHLERREGALPAGPQVWCHSALRAIREPGCVPAPCSGTASLGIEV